jgi:tetratricopeptide (TPR) repeat protein
MGKQSRSKHALRAAELTQPSRAVAPSADQTTPEDRKRLLIASAVLVLAVFVVFAQVAKHDFINFDDDNYVYNNEHVRAGLSLSGIRWALTSFHASYWHPVTSLSHMLDVQLFGLVAGRHLLVNVLLHAANTVLLLLLLHRMTRLLWPSAFVAALFALHPAHVEAVAWLSSRKDVLSTLFLLLAIGTYVSWTRTHERRSYVLTVILFAVGLMAKPIVTFPFILLLLDYWPLRRITFDEPGATNKLLPLITEKLPLFALIIPASILTMKAQSVGLTELPALIDWGNAVHSYAAFLGQLFWPVKLAIIHPYRPVLSSMATIGALSVLAAVTGAVLTQLRKRPYLPFGWFWFVGTLIPVVGIVQAGRQSTADRFTYVPFIGLFIALTWLVLELTGQRREVRRALAAMAAVLLVVLAAVSYVYVTKWQNSETLFRHALGVTQRNAVAHNQMGAAVLDELRYAEAAEQFRAAVAIAPTEISHLGLGNALTGLGKSAEAAVQYRAALALNPRSAEAYRGLGAIELKAGRTNEAVAMFERALALHDDPQTRAIIATARGQYDEAIARYEEALQADPTSAEMRNDYAAVLARSGRDQLALAQYEEALRLAPNQYDARMNLGALLSRMGRGTDAAVQFDAASKVRPRSPEPHIYLALLYSGSGRIPQAIREVETAIAIDPNEANLRFTTAVRMAPKETNVQEYLAYLQQNVKR